MKYCHFSGEASDGKNQRFKTHSETALEGRLSLACKLEKTTIHRESECLYLLGEQYVFALLSS